jgi:hypothetical protein
MRASSARMTFVFCNQYSAVVRGLDPRTHEKPDVGGQDLLSQFAALCFRAKKSAAVEPVTAILTGQQWIKSESDGKILNSKQSRHCRT